MLTAPASCSVSLSIHQKLPASPSPSSPATSNVTEPPICRSSRTFGHLSLKPIRCLFVPRPPATQCPTRCSSSRMQRLSSRMQHSSSLVTRTSSSNQITHRSLSSGALSCSICSILTRIRLRKAAFTPRNAHSSLQERINRLTHMTTDLVIA